MFLSAIIFTFWVGMCLSQDYSMTTTDKPYRAVPLRDIFGELEPFGPENFKDPPKIEPLPKCFLANAKCLKKLKKKMPVCALDKKYGLINFSNICDVYYQNCMAHENDNDTDFTFGVATNTDIIYYNGKDLGCHYYIKKGKTFDNTIKLYYKVGYTETENIDNNKIDG